MVEHLRCWLGNQSIQKKLWLFNLLTAIVSGVLAAILLLVLIRSIEFASARNAGAIKAAIVAENALPALQFRDVKTAEEILNGLGRDGEALDARIVENDGQVFARFAAQRADAAERNVHADVIRVSVPMLSKGVSLATLELTLDTAGVAQKFATFSSAVVLAILFSLLVSSYVMYRLQRAIIGPLTDLTQLMQDVSSGGDLTRRALILRHDELGLLGQSFNRMIEQIEQRNTALGLELVERQRAEEQLEHLAHHDQVTGLPNRHFFRRRTVDLMRGNALQHGSMALLFIDLDNFKQINDNFGHDCGDQLLVVVAERLLASVRGSDMVVRFGGDEFVILVDQIADAETALRLAQKLLTAVTHPFSLGENAFFVTCSIGLALAPQQASTFDELLQRADAAMYAAKSAGKNAVRLWETSISDSSNTRFSIENDLRQALANGEITLHFQPIVELATGVIAGMEALMRWQHPKRGYVPPDEFIPIAEDTGMILELGEWAMRTAFAQAAQWNQRFGPLFMAVNVSGRQFRDRDFAAKAEAIARASGLAREMSELEVTESILMSHTGGAITILEELSARGFSLSLDDFGTGYSSLSYLKRFPIDKLKIDRSFVSDLPHDAEDAAIAEAIIGIARTLSKRTVAEGIENAAQATMLRDLGCRYGQGYYFAKPMPADEMTAFIAAHIAAAGAASRG